MSIYATAARGNELLIGCKCERNKLLLARITAHLSQVIGKLAPFINQRLELLFAASTGRET